MPRTRPPGALPRRVRKRRSSRGAAAPARRPLPAPRRWLLPTATRASPGSSRQRVVTDSTQRRRSLSPRNPSKADVGCLPRSTSASRTRFVEPFLTRSGASPRSNPLPCGAHEAAEKWPPGARRPGIPPQTPATNPPEDRQGCVAGGRSRPPRRRRREPGTPSREGPISPPPERL